MEINKINPVGNNESSECKPLTHEEKHRIQLERMARQLAVRLNVATTCFCKEYQTMDLRGIAGAATLYMAGVCRKMSSKKEALEAAEGLFEIIREILRTTPEFQFGIPEETEEESEN